MSVPVCPWDCPQGRDPLLKQVISPLWWEESAEGWQGQKQEASQSFAEQGRHWRFCISFLIVLYSKSCLNLPGGGGRARADLHLMFLLAVGGLNWGTKEQVYANVNLPFHLSLMQWMWSLPLISSPLSHAGELWKGPSETCWIDFPARAGLLLPDPGQPLPGNTSAWWRYG